MLSNLDVIKKLRRLEAGERVNVKHTKNGKFMNVSDILPLEAEATANPTGGTKSQGRSAGGTSDKMSKEDWAEKDRIKAMNIARAAALKQAVANLKVGTAAEAVLERAEEFLPFLLGESANTMRDDDKYYEG
jgi:hypothetical protein